MREENFDYLKEQVKMTGFGENLAEQLKAKMQSGGEEFQLNHQVKYGEKEISYALNFKKSSTQDNYFFNSFDARLEKPGEVVENRFYTDQRITAKEAFNLLEGRSVEKKYNHHEKIVEGDKEIYRPIKDSTYNVWVKLDFNDADTKGNFKTKTFGEKWGFDLEKKVSELPIKQIRNEEDKADLLGSLKKGNLQSVTFELNGSQETRYIEANPKARAINVYDSNMVPVQEQKQSQKEGAGQKQGKDKIQGTKEEAADAEDGPKQKAKARKSKGQKI